MRTQILLLLALVLLAGCASRPLQPEVANAGEVQAEHGYLQRSAPSQRETSRDSSRMESLPRPLERPLPEFPPALVELNAACQVTLLYHVLVDGTAKSVSYQWGDCPEAWRPAFRESIEIAAARWRYEPAIRAAPEKQPDGSTEIRHWPIPKAMTATIHFRVVEGRGVVE